jgi:hypothetical protein
VLGVWDQATTFPDKSTDHWEELLSEDHLELTEENLQFALEHGGDAELISMLRRVVRRKRWRNGLEVALDTPLLKPLRRVVLGAKDYFYPPPPYR